MKGIAAIVGVAHMLDHSVRDRLLKVVLEKGQAAALRRIIRQVERRIHAQADQRLIALRFFSLIVVVVKVHVPFLLVGTRVDVGTQRAQLALPT